MPEEKPKNIKEVIEKIKSTGFTFHELKPEYFAPAPDEHGEGGGAAYVAAERKREGKGEGRERKERIKITQLRKLFAEIKKLEKRYLKGERDDNKPLRSEFYDELWLLHYELAYAKSRKLIDEEFFALMKAALSREKLALVGDFRRFSQFMTAILAYSKYLSEGRS